MTNNIRTNQLKATSRRQLALLAVALPLAVADAGHTKELYGVCKLADVANERRATTYRLDLLDTQLIQLATTAFTKGGTGKTCTVDRLEWENCKLVVTLTELRLL